MDTKDRSNTVELTADIVAAYVSKHSIRPDEVAKLIGEVHRALSQTPQQKSPVSLSRADHGAEVALKFGSGPRGSKVPLCLPARALP